MFHLYSMCFSGKIQYPDCLCQLYTKMGFNSWIRSCCHSAGLPIYLLGCNVNLKVTFGPDAPLSCAGPWNCLLPQATSSGTISSSPSLLRKFQPAIVCIYFAEGKGQNLTWKWQEFIFYLSTSPARIFSALLTVQSRRWYFAQSW